MLCCQNRIGLACLVGAGVVIGAVGSTLTSTAMAQPENEMSMEQMFKMMKEASEPGEHHKVLEAMVGQFDAVADFTMPDGSQSTSEGESDNQWLLGGRFLGQHYSGEFEGMEFEGYGAIGYHKETDEWESVWMDNFGTGVMMQTGKPGDDPKTIKVSGEYTSMMGTEKMTHVTRIISNDKHVMEFYHPDPATGEMMKHGTITYTRK